MGDWAPGLSGEGHGDQDFCFRNSLSLQPQQDRPCLHLAAPDAQRGHMAGSLLTPLLILLWSSALGSADRGGEGPLGGLTLPLGLTASPPVLSRTPSLPGVPESGPLPTQQLPPMKIRLFCLCPFLAASFRLLGLCALQAFSCTQCPSHRLLGLPPDQTLPWVTERAPSLSPCSFLCTVVRVCPALLGACLSVSPSVCANPSADASALPRSSLPTFFSLSPSSPGYRGKDN